MHDKLHTSDLDVLHSWTAYQQCNSCRLGVQYWVHLFTRGTNFCMSVCTYIYPISSHLISWKRWVSICWPLQWPSTQEEARGGCSGCAARCHQSEGSKLEIVWSHIMFWASPAFIDVLWDPKCKGKLQCLGSCEVGITAFQAEEGLAHLVGVPTISTLSLRREWVLIAANGCVTPGMLELFLVQFVPLLCVW